MTKEDLGRKFEELAGMLDALKTQLNTKADSGGCKKTLRQAYAGLRESSKNLSADVNGYVDKDTSSYETFFAFFRDYEKEIKERKDHVIPHKEIKKEEGRDVAEGNGGWSGKYFDPSLTALSFSGTGAILDMSAMSILLTGVSFKYIVLSFDFSILNGNYFLRDKSKMVALRNAVCAAANLASTISERLKATNTISNMSDGNTAALKTQASGLKTWYM